MSKHIEDLDENLKPQLSTVEDGITWINANDPCFTVRGLPWFEENGRTWHRLPDRMEGVVRDAVWELGRSSSGARVCFRTDATAMHVRATLLHNNTMSHMPLTGSSGLALYEGEPGFEKPWPVAFPSAGELNFGRLLFENLEPKTRTFTLYLPLYNGLDKLLIGLSEGAAILPPPPPQLPHPIIFYGTSITQGGCAHNPGADYPTIVGRHLRTDVVNLGFSGNGRGEPELAHLIAEIPAAAYILDYAANAGSDGLAATLSPFIDILRAKHATTPIVFISHINYSQLTWSKDRRGNHEKSRDIFLREYVKRRDADDANIHFIDGNGLIPYGADLAYSDAGVHPSNTGFGLMADRIAPQLEYILAPLN